MPEGAKSRQPERFHARHSVIAIDREADPAVPNSINLLWIT
jgi:hypothetical protein